MNDIQKDVLEIMKTVDSICSANDLRYSLGFGSVLGAIRHNGFIPWDNDMDILVALPNLEHFREVVAANLPDNMRYINWENENNYSLKEDRVAYTTGNHEVIHLDIFPLIGASDNPVQQKRFQKYAINVVKVFHCKHRRVEDTAEKNRWKMRLIKPILQLVPDSTIRRTYKSIDEKYDYADSSNVFVSGSPSMGCLVPKVWFDELIRVPFENSELPVPLHYHDYLTSLYGDYLVERQTNYYV